jgi:hypothetical protein
MPGELEGLQRELDSQMQRLGLDHVGGDDDDGADEDGGNSLDESVRITSRPKRPRRHRRRHSAQERAHRRKLDKLRLRTPGGRRAIKLRRLALAVARRRGLDLRRTSIDVETGPVAELNGLLERLREL